MTIIFLVGIFSTMVPTEDFELIDDDNKSDEVSGRASADWDWSTVFGSVTGNDQGWGIVVDQYGSSFVAGSFKGTVVFGTCSTCTHTSQGDNDIFIAKLDDQGVVIWVNTAGGINGEAPIGHITALDNGNYAIAGYVPGGNPVQFGASITLNPTGVRALLIATFDNTGNWVWAKEWSGAHSTSDVIAHDITADSTHIYVTGYFKRSMTFNGITYNANTNGNPGFTDLFIAKATISGNDVWAKVSDGWGSDGGKGVAVASNGDVYVTGYHGNNAHYGATTLMVTPSSGCGTNNYNPSDGLVAKLDSSGNWLWAISQSGCHLEQGISIEITPGDNIVFSIDYTGEFYLSDIAGTTPASPYMTPGHSNGIAVVKMKPSGHFIWYDVVRAYDNHLIDLEVSSVGDIILCGFGVNYGNLISTHSNPQFDNQWDNTPTWLANIWIVKFSSNGELGWVVSSGGQGSQGESKPRDCALDSDNTPYVTGWMDGDVMFDIMQSDSSGMANDDGTVDAIVGKLWPNTTTLPPAPCTSFNSTAGPLWEDNSSNPVSTGEIYEFPANSGTYWQVIQDSQLTPNPGMSPDIWSDPCTCFEIWSAMTPPLVWDSSTTYPTNTIVEYPQGSYELWIADYSWAGVTPPTTNNLSKWIPCEGTRCATLNGMVGPVWDASTSVLGGEIYEYPANSGDFWQALVTPSSSTSSLSPPTNPDVWAPSCNCTEIWTFGGQQVWDVNQVYTQYELVESPPGSVDIWSPLVPNILGGASPEFSLDWDGCGDTMTPCEAAASADNNWPMWTVLGPPYSVGDIVSYGNEFYISIRPLNTVEPGPAGVIALAWVECTCDQLKPGLPEYVSTNSYQVYDGVVFNNEVYWAIDTTPAGNSPGPNQYWRTCNWCDSSTNNIKEEWNAVAAQNDDYMIGDLVTQNNVIWVSIMNYNPTIPVGGVVIWFNAPWYIPPLPYWDVGWVECDCSEVAVDYVPGTLYQEGDIILGPDGNTWISEYSNNPTWPSIIINPGGTWTWTIPTWKLCTPGTCANPIPWDSSTASYGGYFSGDAVSHLSNSWKLMQGYSGTSISPDLSMIQNPGPWKLCKLIPLSPNILMSPTYSGEVNIDLKSVESAHLETETGNESLTRIEDGKMFSGFNQTTNMRSNAQITSAIWLEKSITEIESTSLQRIVENNIIIVDKCNDKYNLNGYNEEKYLCGVWFDAVFDWNASGVENSVLMLRPGMLCPTGEDAQQGCHDIILDITQSENEEPDDDCTVWEHWNPELVDKTKPGNGCPSYTDPTDVTEDKSEESSSGLPGFEFNLLIVSILFAFVIIRRRES
ncbi:MAG: hypothetical protein NZ774_02025 [Candidatus Poseidoniales archaeon]|nr:hypothetical protein [Candidatus Poseidoniales archaeon]